MTFQITQYYDTNNSAKSHSVLVLVIKERKKPRPKGEARPFFAHPMTADYRLIDSHTECHGLKCILNIEHPAVAVAPIAQIHRRGAAENIPPR